MSNYYSGTYEEVKFLLNKIITIGIGKADILTPELFEEHQKIIDQVINGKLSTTYFTPLTKISRDGKDKYPDAIVSIAQKLVVANIVNTYFKDIRPEESNTVKIWEEQAILQLQQIVNGVGSGAINLDGQTLLGKNRFVRPEIAPVPIPGGPTAGPAGGIG